MNLFSYEEVVLTLSIVNDRNLAVDMYNEEAAVKIQSNIMTCSSFGWKE
ncbi:hypothetical protein ACFQIC_16265 [Halobacillus seohaensis]|uniref:Uncharacterized protein n=1 Tax=Halobacillus seohaensis TaxID=447421 RepID=A0ABW2EQJ2_9BACI